MKRHITLYDDDDHDPALPSETYKKLKRSGQNVHPSTRNEQAITRNNDIAVGTLYKLGNGVQRELLITLKTVLSIGRHPSCDIVVKSPYISQFHLRVCGITTSTGLNLAILHDTSSNGYYLNDKKHGVLRHRGDRTSLVTRNVVLRNGDQIHLSGCDAVFRYEQSSFERSANIFNTEVPADVRLFPSLEPSLIKEVGPWVIYNYPLGHGSFGIINLGTHSIRSDLQFAIKTVYPDRSRTSRARLLKEFKIHKSAQHPNILRMVDYVSEGKSKSSSETIKIHLVLDLITGGDLWSYIERNGHLIESEVRWIAFQLVKALQYLHEKGIVHRDIKPENILLYCTAPYPRLLIADFGQSTSRDFILSSLHEGGAHVKEYQDLGTMEYVAPEHLKGCVEYQRGYQEEMRGKKDDVAALWFQEQCGLDVWALAVTLWFSATSSHPYQHLGEVEWRQYGQPDRNATLRPGNSAHSEARRNMSDIPDDPIASFASDDEGIGSEGEDIAANATLGSEDGSPESELIVETLGEMSISRCLSDDTITSELPYTSSGNLHVWGESRHADLFRQIEIFSSKRSREWPHQRIWSEWSEAGIEFLQDGMKMGVDERITMIRAEGQAWFAENEDELQMLHDKMIVKGEVMRCLL